MKKKQFVEAFIWHYGATVQEAEKMYREVSPQYIDAIILVYKNHCRRAFFSD